MAAQDETRKLLADICARVGGAEKLGEKLGISSRVLTAYITGKELIPDVLILRVVDVVLADIEVMKTDPAAPPPAKPAAQSPPEVKPGPKA